MFCVAAFDTVIYIYTESFVLLLCALSYKRSFGIGHTFVLLLCAWTVRCCFVTEFSRGQAIQDVVLKGADASKVCSHHFILFQPPAQQGNMVISPPVSA